MERAEVAAPRLSISIEVGPYRVLWRLLHRTDFLPSAAVGALALALVYYWLLLRETTIHTMTSKLAGEPIYLGALGVLALTALLLFGLNFALLGIQLRARAVTPNQGGSLLGMVVGGFGVGCPSCGAFLLSLVGVSAGVSALPFGGLELWLASCMIMGFAFWRSLRRLGSGACAASVVVDSCPALPPVSPRHVVGLAVTALVLGGVLAAALVGNEPFLTG